ncbi:MAG: hypothetical protein QOG70_2639 [Solirubrobacteraceae bacterium]|nr:hypothetical protein [Solirubrobacteraceae bacterium]
MTKEVLALALTVLVHVIGMAALVWALLLDDESRPDWRGWWPGGDDDPAEPGPSRPGGGLPLPDADPSAVRLRDGGRLADALPRPARRPQHPPERVPAREREPR